MTAEPKVTPELVEEHGLTQEEFDLIREILGRMPTFTELGIFSVMWSEHCSYKNSRLLLKTLPTEGPRILQGPGENAGVVDIGDGLAVVFKIESHNHPSAVEPYQGAATGIGGILRDIFTMGARPIALLDSLRFGDLSDERVRYLFRGVISGIADYGNCVGIPTVAGEVYFDEAYRGNPLVNVMAVGMIKKADLIRACARGAGNPVIYYGGATGPDGIHGCTFASEELGEDSESRRPAVQVGDPFTEKLIMEATLELVEKGLLVGVQDMGAAGLTCSTCEMASRGDTGIDIDLDLVPKRAKGLTAYEIMLSESQERMLACCLKEKEPEVRAVLEKWGLQAHRIGEVTDDGIMRVRQGDREVARIPARRLAEEAPVYKRESVCPGYYDYVRKLDVGSLQEPEDLNLVVLDLLSYPTMASKEWVYRQYDHMIQLRTVVLPGGDAAVLRIPGTRKAIAVTADGNGFYVYLDPRIGTMIAVAEAARNLVVTGAQPLAVTNCLNFGNPMKPEIFWQFENAVMGLGEACRELGTPVTGGNVSFYNETEGRAVYPTPVIGMVGLIEDQEHITPAGFQQSGDRIVMLGYTRDELGGSQYLRRAFGIRKGPCPTLNMGEEREVQRLCLDAIRQGMVRSAHDVSEGGLAVALAECCIRSPSGLGARIDYRRRKRDDIILFGESQSRILLSVPEDRLSELERMAFQRKVPYSVLGTVEGGELAIVDRVELRVEVLGRAYRNALSRYLEVSDD